MVEKSNNLVLIVDDNPHNIQVLAAVVSECGYQPGIAMSGMQALEFLKQESPSLILLDVMMPDYDGYQVCEIIKKDERFSDIPIIFLTAKNERDDIVKGFAAGGVDYVTKPFYSDELKMRINTHMELKKNRDRLVSLNRELEMSNAFKDKYFSIIAHDLKTPFNSLIGFSSLLKEEAANIDTETIQHYSEAIHTTAMNTFRLLENLLEWARMQQGKMVFEPASLEVRSVAEGVRILFDDVARRKNVALNNCMDAEIHVRADENMLNTIFRNLISNAIKFTHAGGVVDIRAEVQGNTVEVSVADTGVGMDTAGLMQFDVDGAIEPTRGTEGEKGTGLGLLLCKDFVERHDGRLHVDSSPGNGSTFTFTLPKA